MSKYKESLDLSDVHGESGFTTMERTGIRPTLDVNGIWGGYTGEGAKTVIPSKAYAKISMRLVPNQTDEEITKKFTNYFKKIAPRIADIIGAVAIMTSVFATFVFCIETTKVIFVTLNVAIYIRPWYPVVKRILKKLNL